MATVFAKNILASVTVAFFALSTQAVESTTTKLPKKAKRAAASEPAAMTSSTSVQVAKPAVVTENIALSEYAYQTGVGQSQLSVAPVSITRNYTVRPNQAPKTPADFTTSGTVLALQYQQGFGENSSLRVGSTIGDLKTSTKGSEDVLESGLANIDVTWQKVSGTGSTVQKFWGVEGSISPAPMELGYEYKAPKKSGTGNRYTGGHSFKPFLGTQSDRGNVILGGKASLQVMLERTGTTKNTVSDIDISTTGGNVIGLEGFAEIPGKNFRLGFKGGLNLVSAIDTTLTQTSSKTRTTAARDASQYIHIGVYGNIRYSPRVEILPTIDITNLMSSASGSNSLEAANELQLGLAARIGL